MPDLRRFICPRRAVASGSARLEFAVTVFVFGVIGAFGLDHIANLKVLAGIAQRQTTAAQQRALVALQEARCGSASTPAPTTTSTTDPVTPVPANSKGTPLGLAHELVLTPPCPGTAPTPPRSHPTVPRKE